MSEGNVQESGPSFCQVGSGGQTQMVKSGSNPLPAELYVASLHPCVFETGSLTSPTQWSPESWGYRQLSFYMGAGVKPSAEQALHQLSQLHHKFYLTNWQCFRLLLFYSCSLELKHINTFFLRNNKSLTMAPVNEVTV